MGLPFLCGKPIFRGLEPAPPTGETDMKKPILTTLVLLCAVRMAWADAVIDGDTVVVSNPEVKKPVAVRYA